jgi:hypothetical protein
MNNSTPGRHLASENNSASTLSEETKRQLRTDQELNMEQIREASALYSPNIT